MKRPPSLTEGFGKIPPQSINLEEAVLGALMLDKNCVEDILQELTEDAFYKDAHQVIYKAIRSLHSRHEPIDILTVYHEIKKSEQLELLPSPVFLTELTAHVASANNAIHHVKIINQNFAKRELIRLCATSMQEAYEDSSDVFTLFENVENGLSKTKDAIIGKANSVEWETQVNETVTVLEQLQRAEVKLSGIPTGNKKIDLITGGWQRSDLIILAARPAIGKTSRLLNFVKSACLFEKNVVMFSLEMGYRQIARKFINEDSEVYGQKLISGELSQFDMTRIEQTRKKLIGLPFHLNDAGGINPNFIRAVLKRRKKKRDIDMVVIDYLQLMKPNEFKKGQSRDSEVGSIVMDVKNIAKEFDIPIIALAQLSRKCEERVDKRPILSDLRESGNLEQEADLVMGLYRPSYYYQLSQDKDYRDEYTDEKDYKQLSELHILKHRNGQTDRFIKERFMGELSRFTPLETLDQVFPKHYEEHKPF